MGILSSIGKAISGVTKSIGLPGASLIGGGLDFLGQSQANNQQIASAREQMKFQERMSSTSYQRAMKDMEKAGLNRILAYQKGGASTPGGAQPNIKNPLGGANTAAQSYIASKTAQANIANIEANTALTLEKANTEKLTQDNLVANTGFTSARTLTQTHLTEQERIRVETAFATLGKSRMEAIQAEQVADRLINQGNIDRSEVGELVAWIQRAKEVGLGLDTISKLLAGKKKGAALPAIPSPENGFKP